MLAPDPEGAIRYDGIVTSFSTNTAWGFIACPDLSTAFGKDIFFHLKDCGGATISKGQKVSFLLEESNAHGKPQARSIRGAQHTPDPIDAMRYTGTVTSFSATSAWGFIACPDLVDMYGKDVFFHLKDCGGANVEKGQTVTFLVDENSQPNKPQARSIRVEGGEPMSMQQPTSFGAFGAGSRRYRGTVTNFSSTTAWGFIQCPELQQVFGKDVFLHQKDCGVHPISKGTSVTFDLDHSDPTRPQARNVRVEGGGGHTQSQNSASLGSLLGGSGNSGLSTTMLAQAAVRAGLLGPAGQVGHQGPTRSSTVTPSGSNNDYSGFIQSFSEQAGWGFIECPVLGLSQGKGVFFHIKDCVGLAAHQLARGQAVIFSLGTGPSGKPQAIQVRFTAQPQMLLDLEIEAGQKRTSTAAQQLALNPQVAGLVQAICQLRDGAAGALESPVKRARV